MGPAISLFDLNELYGIFPQLATDRVRLLSCGFSMSDMAMYRQLTLTMSFCLAQSRIA